MACEGGTAINQGTIMPLFSFDQLYVASSWPISELIGPYGCYKLRLSLPMKSPIQLSSGSRLALNHARRSEHP